MFVRLFQVTDVKYSQHQQASILNVDGRVKGVLFPSFSLRKMNGRTILFKGLLLWLFFFQRERFFFLIGSNAGPGGVRRTKQICWMEIRRI